MLLIVFVFPARLHLSCSHPRCLSSKLGKYRKEDSLSKLLTGSWNHQRVVVILWSFGEGLEPWWISKAVLFCFFHPVSKSAELMVCLLFIPVCFWISAIKRVFDMLWCVSSPTRPNQTTRWSSHWPDTQRPCRLSNSAPMESGWPAPVRKPSCLLPWIILTATQGLCCVFSF